MGILIAFVEIAVGRGQRTPGVEARLVPLRGRADIRRDIAPLPLVGGNVVDHLAVSIAEWLGE